MQNGVPKALLTIILVTLIMGGTVLALPFFFTLTLRHEQALAPTTEQFPVTVDPKNKLITENTQVNDFLTSPSSPLTAAVGTTGDLLWRVLAAIASTLSDAPWYQGLAAVDGRLVTITPGMRKEQVADTFAHALSWNSAEKKVFLTATTSSSLPFFEGTFSPGTYVVSLGTTPEAAQELVNARFTHDILAHYGTTTAATVSLNDALTIASLIQRETIGTTDMRLVSGIIWNRLFANMNLQIDSTLQYAKANTKNSVSWWPKVVPADVRRHSPYNTYLNPGLPPTPIANPSVAAVLAALNPIKTSCLFYFNDAAGTIHCSDTYAQHVALLQKYYGHGK
jgi:cell division protein YceG involved in septum cleavage